MMTPEDQRSHILDIADERLRHFFNGSILDANEKAWNALGIIGLVLHEISESQLRILLEITGVDLWDPEQFDAVSNVVTAFSQEGIIVVTDKLDRSLVDLDTDLHWRTSSDEYASYFARVKTDGVFFRTVLAPEFFASV